MLRGVALLGILAMNIRGMAAPLSVAVSGIAVGLTLAWYGAIELERIRFAMPDRAITDLWNYAGAVFASVGYAALIILAIKVVDLPAPGA